MTERGRPDAELGAEPQAGQRLRRLVEDGRARPSAGPLRSLDALHIAAAQQLGSDLEAIITYDRRMARAADPLGIATIAPSGA